MTATEPTSTGRDARRFGFRVMSFVGRDPIGTEPNGCRTMTSATAAGRDATPGPVSGWACAVLDRRSSYDTPSELPSG